MSLNKQVGEFHRACEVEERERPGMVDRATQRFRIGLIEEELEELIAACAVDDIVEVADALGDIAYVVYGMARVYGIDLDEVTDEIHRSNMTKTTGGKVERREDGKVLKPAHYQAPDLDSVLRGQALR